MKTLIKHICLASFFICLAHADGPGLGEDKLYNGGAVVLLRLTADQKKFLEKEHKNQREGALRLTKSQSKKIKEILKIKTTLLEVWDTRKNETDCTCASANIALRFADDYLEVLPYLVTDKEAIDKWKSWEEIK
jgi:hypothetical protein